MMGYYSYGMGVFGWLTMMLFWGLVIAAIVYFFRKLDQGTSSPTKALEIAKERYAKGEISKDEFDQLRHDLA